MANHHLTHGTRFIWNDELYQITKILLHGRIEIHDVKSWQPRIEDRQALIQAWADGALVFAPPNYTLSQDKPPQNPPTGLSLDDHPLAYVARWRLEVIKPFVDRTRVSTQELEERLAEVSAQLTEGQRKSSYYRVSLSTLGRWRRTYRDSGNDIRALLPHTRGRGGPGQRRLDAVVNAILIATIRDYEDADLPPTVKEVHEEVMLRIKGENSFRSESDQLSCPAYSTVWRRICELDMEDRFLKYKSKRPSNWAAKRVEKPLEVVEIDDTYADVIVVSEGNRVPIGRLTFTAVTDVATGYPLGHYIGFEEPSHYTVQEALFHAIMPKVDTTIKYGTRNPWLAQGIPQVLRFDRGKNYTSSHLDDALQLLGIEPDKLPPRTPFFKPFVERYFRSSAEGTFHLMDGTTFSNYIKRGTYDSLQSAALTLSEVEMLLHKWMLDIYLEEPHSRTKIPRSVRWKELTKPPFQFRLPRSPLDLYISLGWVEYRVINDYGIVINHIRYQDRPKLQRLQDIYAGEKAKIKLHRGDLSRIYVFDPTWDESKASEDEFPYVEVLAVNQDYTRMLSAWQHQVILKHQRVLEGSVDRTLFAETRREIRQDSQDALAARRSKGGKKKRAGRFLSVPESVERVYGTNDLMYLDNGEEENEDPQELVSDDWEIKPVEGNQWGIVNLPEYDDDWEIANLPKYDDDGE